MIAWCKHEKELAEMQAKMEAVMEVTKSTVEAVVTATNAHNVEIKALREELAQLKTAPPIAMYHY